MVTEALLNPAATAGHNAPPDTDPLVVRGNEAIDQANKWLTERSDLDKWDASVADKAQFFISQIATAFDDLDGQRLKENREHDSKQDAKYGKGGDPAKGRAGSGVLGLLKNAALHLTNLRRGWLQREEKRLAAEAAAQAEEAKRLADEADAAIRRAEEEAAKKGGDPLRAAQAAQDLADKAADAAKQTAEAPVRAQIKGSYTTTAVGLKDRWSAEITDISLAFKNYNKKGHPAKSVLEAAIRECIQGIADKEAKLIKSEDTANFPPGIKFKKERV